MYYDSSTSQATLMRQTVNTDYEWELEEGLERRSIQTTTHIVTESVPQLGIFLKLFGCISWLVGS